MMNFEEAGRVRNDLPKTITKVLSFGHIGQDCFSGYQLYQLKNGELKDLATQKVAIMTLGDNVYEPIGLWGEDNEGMSNDIGVACIFINGNSHAIPEHFMPQDRFRTFIVDTVKEHYPEYLI